MKQLFIRRGGVKVEENVPAPMIEPDHVLVEVAYSLISSGTEATTVESSKSSLVKRVLGEPDKLSQLMKYLKERGIRKTVAMIRRRLEGESPSGYSCSGVVLQVGDGITEIKPGDRVACAGSMAVHAEVVLVPKNLFIRVPDECDLKAAASVALGAIAMQGVRRSDVRLGEIVAVIGLGLVGQITVQLLKLAGCQVIGLELNPRRVRLAEELGADHAFVSSEIDAFNQIRHLTEGHGVDSTIITASSRSDAILQEAMDITRKKGRVVIVGAVGLGLKRSPFYEKEIDVLISCSYGPGRYDEKYERTGIDYPYPYVRWTENRNMAEYLRLLALERVKITPILEHEYDLADAARAYEELAGGVDRPVGVVLRYPINDQRALTKKLERKVTLQSARAKGKINLAVVGAGGFATSIHLPNLQEMSDLYHLRALVSRTGSNVRSAGKLFRVDYATTNYEDVLKDPDVKAVVICTRHHLHAPQVVAALKSAKNVFVEKPLCLNTEELSEILRCYDLSLVDFENGVQPVVTGGPILMVGFNRRFSPALTRIKEIVIHRRNPLVMVYRVNAGYLPPEHWIYGPEGGGRIVGEGCHMFDVFNFLVNAPVQSISIESVPAQLEHMHPTDNWVATLSYLDGSICTLVYSALGANGLGKEYLEVFVDGKAIVMNDYRSLKIFGMHGKNWSATSEDKGHKQALMKFAECLKSSELRWPIELADLVNVTQVTLGVSEQVVNQK